MAPRFNKLYADLGVDLPFVTRIVLAPGFRLAVAGLAVLALGKELWMRNSRNKLLLNGGFIVVLWLLVFASQYATFEPFVRIVEKLG